MSTPVSLRTFTCVQCLETFNCTRSEEAVMDEFLKCFPKYAGTTDINDFMHLCDRCYEEVMSIPDNKKIMHKYK